MGARMLGGIRALTDSVSYISCPICMTPAKPANYFINTTAPMVWPVQPGHNELRLQAKKDPAKELDL